MVRITRKTRKNLDSLGSKDRRLPCGQLFTPTSAQKSKRGYEIRTMNGKLVGRRDTREEAKELGYTYFAALMINECPPKPPRPDDETIFKHIEEWLESH